MESGGSQVYGDQNATPNFFHGSLIHDKADKAGTFYRRNRTYDPGTGRFTQEDPIGLAGGLNLYGYAAGDPVNFSDPFGLSPCRGAAAVGTAIVASVTDGPLPVGDLAATACLGAAALAKWGPALGRGVDRARTAVYSAVENGRTLYIGITNNLEARAAAHAAEKGISVRALPGLSNLSRADARAVEQVLIEFHGLGKNGGTLLNRINSIAKSNDKYADALMRGRDLLLRAGYEGMR